MFRFLVAAAVISVGIVSSAEAGWRRCCGMTCCQPACCQPISCSACAPAPAPCCTVAAPAPCCAPAPVVVACCPAPVCCPAPTCCPTTTCCRPRLFRRRCCDPCVARIEPAPCCQTAYASPIFGRPMLFSAFRPRVESQMAIARAKELKRQEEAARIARASRQPRSGATRSNLDLAYLAD